MYIPRRELDGYFVMNYSGMSFSHGEKNLMITIYSYGSFGIALAYEKWTLALAYSPLTFVEIV
jgi:hypothetical protein